MHDTDFIPTRRGLIAGGLAASALALAPEANAGRKPSFTFVHITDTHIQPELNAAQGVHKAFAAIRALPEKPAFGLVGGDLVMDATAVPRARAEAIYDLWQQEAATLKLPLYYSIGNHDLYDLKETNAARAADPDWGKGLWKQRLSLERTYGTFDHYGWRFVTLDSAGITPMGAWEGVLDDVQVTWLDNLLRATPVTQPLVFLTHFPIFTIFGQYTEGTTSALGAGLIVKNGKAFKEMIQKHNVKAVLQGHTHVVEECTYLGVRYITGGAVCGDWWKGKRLGVHPEGYSVLTVTGDDLAWRYVPYGWQTAPATDHV